MKMKMKPKKKMTSVLLRAKRAAKPWLGMGGLALVSMQAQAQVSGGGEGRFLAALQDTETLLMNVVPIICTIAFIVCGVMYMARAGSAAWLGSIAGGAIMVGMASYLSGMFLG